MPKKLPDWSRGSRPVMQLQHPFELYYLSDKPVQSGVFHSHPFYEIFYFHEGACTYLIGDRIFTLKPGDLLLMNGLTLHCPYVEQDTAYVRSILHFDPALFEQWLLPVVTGELLRPFEQLRNCRITLKPSCRKEFENLLEEMSRLAERNRGAVNERLTLRLMELLYLINECCEAEMEAEEAVSEKERYVQQVIAYVEQHFMNPVSLSDIAGAVHLTKPYLSSLFKEVTGTTVLKYVYSRRINQAKILLQYQQELTVTEVCRSVGFKHPAHFSRMFKEMVGATAEEYRLYSTLR